MIEEKTIKEHCRKLVEEVFIDGLCECDLSGISIGILLEVLESMGYEMISDGIDEHPSIDTNGWEIDFWSKIYKKDENTPLFTIDGSVMYAQLRIRKCD